MTGEERFEYLDALEVEERNEQLGKLDEDERNEFIAGLPGDTRLRWSTEELEHLQGITADQPSDGAEFGEDPHETVELPGADTPMDRAPEVGKALIEELVGRAVKAETEALRLQIALDAANAEVQAYYEKYGQL